MLTRVAQHSRHTIAAELEIDGAAPTVTGTPTVTVTAEDGTVVVNAQNASGSSPNYTYTLTPTHTADLGLLTAVWSATVSGSTVELTTQHEVVGGHVVTLTEMRRHEPLDDTANYSAADLIRARDLATYALERACNRGFTRHRAREIVQPSQASYLPLRGRLIQSVEAVTVGTTALDATALAAVYADRAGYLYRSTPWNGTENVTVTYEHGEQVSAPEIGRAICKIAAEVLFEDELGGEGSAIPDRATSLSTEQGTFSLVTAGIGSAVFSTPEVNRVVESWRIP